MIELAFRNTDRLSGGVLRRVARGFVAPLLGMTMLWPMFRYGAFIRVLFPATQSVALGGLALTGHVVYLCLIACLAVGAWAGRARLADLIQRRRPLCAGLMALGGPGAWLAIRAQDAASASGAVLVLSAALVAVGVLMAYLCWGSYVSSRLCAGSAVLVVASFLLSYLCFSYTVPLGSLIGSRIGSVALPLGCALAWLLCTPSHGPEACSDEEARGAVEPLHAEIPLLAIAATLTIGAAVRGIVDMHAAVSPVRLATSLALDLAWLVGTLTAFALRRRNPMPQAAGPRVVARFSLVSWCAFVFAFLVGLFAFLALGQTQLGGDIVVSSRTAMGVALWLILCCLSATSPAEEALRPFLQFGLSVEIASWFLSYALIPGLLHPGDEGVLSPEVFVLAVIFGILALLLAAVTFKMGFVGLSQEGCAPTTETEPSANAADAPDALDKLARSCRLTEREAAVVGRYAQGLSLAKVAQDLGISKSTAQSHIKNAYRKLDVHSRDELIERIRG